MVPICPKWHHFLLIVNHCLQMFKPQSSYHVFYTNLTTVHSHLISLALVAHTLTAFMPTSCQPILIWFHNLNILSALSASIYCTIYHPWGWFDFLPLDYSVNLSLAYLSMCLLLLICVQTFDNQIFMTVSTMCTLFIHHQLAHSYPILVPDSCQHTLIIIFFEPKIPDCWLFRLSIFEPK